MQGVVGLSTSSKEEVCSLQAGAEPQVGRQDRTELSSIPCRTCGLCFTPPAVYHEHLRVAEPALYKDSLCGGCAGMSWSAELI